MDRNTPALHNRAPDAGWTLYGTTLSSRFLLGTAGYPSPQTLADSIAASGTQIVTVGLKRTLAAAGDNGFIAIIQAAVRERGARLLPNTAGCRTAREAITLAHMARELLRHHLDQAGGGGRRTHAAARPLGHGGSRRRNWCTTAFTVFPYCTDDLVTCQRLLDAGCELLMPWGAPIGSGQGLINPFALRTLRARLPGVPLIVDAGIGAPSHAAQAMELGMDGVLLNSAVSQAVDPVRMARAFGQAIEAGRGAFEAGVMAPQSMAVASTPVSGHPFLLD